MITVGLSFVGSEKIILSEEQVVSQKPEVVFDALLQDAKTLTKVVNTNKFLSIINLLQQK